MTTRWSELKPALADPLAEFPSVATQQAVAFREGISQHFVWSQSSGASAGQPLLSDGSLGPGSARAFYSTATSELSASKDGRLFLSAVSGSARSTRLWAVPAAGPVLLGSACAVVADPTFLVGSSSASLVPMVAGTRWLVQSGSTTGLTSTVTGAVAFATAYTTPPRVVVAPLVSTASQHAFRLSLVTVNGSGFSYFATQYGSAVSYGFVWYSEGTVSL